MIVIAKAYNGEPLQRLLTGHANGLVYVINPSVVDSGDIVELSGVGFPPDSIFEYHPDDFSRLKSAWESRNADELADAWSQMESVFEHA